MITSDKNEEDKTKHKTMNDEDEYLGDKKGRGTLKTPTNEPRLRATNINEDTWHCLEQ